MVYSQIEISGYIQESGSGERLPYSNIYLDDLQLGASANENGFFSFKGEVTLWYDFKSKLCWLPN